MEIMERIYFFYYFVLIYETKSFDKGFVKVTHFHTV